jgi:RNA polymerase sigma-70 factor, ECF subfamily
MLEDKLLIWKLKHGSSEALEQIYKKYEAFLITVALALSHRIEIAEDTVHDVFVSLVSSAHKLKLHGNLKAYLAICVANRARDRLRSRQRAPGALDPDIFIESTAWNPEFLAMQQEEHVHLSNAMARLSFEQREVIVLHLYGSMKFTQIAKLREASVNTVRSQYRYGSRHQTADRN